MTQSLQEAALARPPDELLSGWRYRAVIGSVLLTALGYLAFSLWGGWAEVTAAVRRVGPAGIAAALALSLANYGLRFLRWQAYLGAMGHAVPPGPSLQAYLAGFALTTTPGKAGETLRGVLLRRWGVPYPQSFAAFFSERLSDLLAVLLLALLGLSLYPQARPLLAAGAVLVALALLLLANAHRLQRPGLAGQEDASRPGRLRQQLLQVLLEARRCHRPALLCGAMGLSLAAWGAEAWAFHLMLQWMGLDVPLAFAVFVYAASMLAGALSFMPGGIGGAEGAMVALLLIAKVPAADAVAATVLIRLATLWFAVGIGALALGRSHFVKPGGR